MVEGLTEYTYEPSSHRCLVQKIRDALSVTYQENFTGIDMVDHQTQIEFVAKKTRHTTCADCAYMQDAILQRKAIMDAAASVDLSDPCWAIHLYSDK